MFRTTQLPNYTVQQITTFILRKPSQAVKRHLCNISSLFNEIRSRRETHMNSVFHSTQMDRQSIETHTHTHNRHKAVCLKKEIAQVLEDDLDIS